MSGPTVKFTVDFGRRHARPVAAPPSRQDTAARPPTMPTTPTAPVTTAARTLALAHWIERQLREGRFLSYRAVANHLGVSHTRVGHIAALAYLSTAIQHEVLLERSHVGERELRRMARAPLWP